MVHELLRALGKTNWLTLARQSKSCTKEKVPRATWTLGLSKSYHVDDCHYSRYCPSTVSSAYLRACAFLIEQYWLRLSSIVAIHGLNPFNRVGHGTDTWRKPTGRGGHLWLKDALPNSLPTVRTMLYNYDPSPGFGGKVRLAPEATQLLENLRMTRMTVCIGIYLGLSISTADIWFDSIPVVLLSCWVTVLAGSSSNRLWWTHNHIRSTKASLTQRSVRCSWALLIMGIRTLLLSHLGRFAPRLSSM
jgi:hypothetical protein